MLQKGRDRKVRKKEEDEEEELAVVNGFYGQVA
jgi:hypothetical protein